MATNSAAPNPAHIPFLHLDQGVGGTFNFPYSTHDGPDSHWIGTYNCYTCVCVFIPLGQTSTGQPQCFVAHIDAHTGPKYDPIRDWITDNEFEQTSLKAHVHKRLAAALPDLSNGQYADYKRELRDNAIIVCPRRMRWLRGDFEMNATGRFIIQAVREFFRLPEGSHVTDFAHGFTVNPQTGEKRLLKWVDGNLSEAALSRWDRLDMKRDSPHDSLEAGELAELEQLVTRRQRRYPESYGFKVGAHAKSESWSLQFDRDTKSWGPYV
ncbi:unnamed protein product [Zymoseptoria tritici ST99CH_3D1]|nr:unnamed protein product [Zymoseptoria tritici ST99CH_3D1]